MSAPAAAVPRRDRQLYRSKGDGAILAQVAKYQFLTVEMAAEELQRNVIAVRRRMFQLFQASLLNRTRRDRLFPFVYYLSEKGSEEAIRLGHLNEPRFINSKSPLIVNHDLEITMFHRALEKACPDHLGVWEQWRGAMKIDVDGEALIPDARFSLDDGERRFFLEIVKSYESEYEDGRSNIERKLDLYNRWWKGEGDDFRVLFVLPTTARVAHLLGKIEEEFPYRRFYFTDEESYRRDILGKIWWTPRDFRDTTYSLIHESS